MKNIKILLLIPFFLIFFSFSVFSQDYNVDGADKVEQSLGDEASDFLNSYGISPDSTDWIDKLSAENIFTHILSFIRNGYKAPLKAGIAALAIVITGALISALSVDSETSKNAVVLCSLSLAVFLCVQVYSTISAAGTAIKGVSTFMLSFVPMYAGIVAVSGGAASSIAMSSLLLGAAEGAGMLSAYVIVPLMGGYLAVSLCTAVSPLTQGNSAAESLKKISLWVLSLISTVFLGVLGIQTTVNSAADSLALRTSKFIVGTAVPVAGAVLSEAAATVTASMQMLKSTAGIYGIIALCLLLLPIVTELLFWRITMMVLGIVSEILESGKISGIFKAVDSMLALLTGIILLIGALFIISLTVVVSTGKSL